MARPKYVNKTYTAVAQDIIQISEDKLKLILNDYESRLGKQTGWHAPLTLFVSLVFAFVTTETKQILGLSADTWKAIFVMSIILAFIWLCFSIYIAYKYRNVGAILAKIKELCESSEI